MPRSAQITVVGSINVDLVAYCDRLPRPGETVGGAEFAPGEGGKGANQAVAAARLGADVQMIGCVGDDEFGREAVFQLEQVGVDVRRIVEWGGHTGVALILVEGSGENQIVVASGANHHLHPDDVEIRRDDDVMCQLEIPLDTVAAAAEKAMGRFCLNAAPAQRVPPDIVRRADLVVVNRHEREALGEDVPGLLAVTMGEEGAVLFDAGKEVARARPPEVEVVDGTAAGDAFCAALFVGWVEGRPLEHALRRACAAGAIAASRRGAQHSVPTDSEIDAILDR